jgi:hypothetical protein
MEKNNLPKCRECPGRYFELALIAKPNFGPTRKFAICHALEVVLQPLFPDEKIEESMVISKANERTVRFEPVDNCPFLEKLRAQGLIPWASTCIDFLNKPVNQLA